MPSSTTQGSTGDEDGSAHIQKTHRVRRHKVLLGTGGLVVVLLIAYVVAFFVLQPSEPGSFYETPDDLPTDPGTLIRYEAVDTDVRRADGHKILYSSHDRHGRTIAVSGMVLVPRKPPPDAGFPVVAWAHGTSGIARDCAPSLSPRSTTQNVAGAQDLVDAGYIVAATDYQGLGTEGPHPYLVGKSEAYAVLDSVKALQDQDLGPAASRFALWGYSQGGHAALFAAQQAPDHASDLELVGVAVAAPATALATLLEHDLTEPAGKAFGSMALKSWSQVFPDAGLDGIVKTRDRPLVDVIAKGCIETDEQGLVLLPEVALMSKDFVSDDPTTTPPWDEIIRQNTVEPRGVDVPLLVAQGSADSVVEPQVSKRWAAKMCGQNPSVGYRTYSGKDHLSIGPAAAADVRSWMHDRFAGRTPEADCDDLR